MTIFNNLNRESILSAITEACEWLDIVDAYIAGKRFNDEYIQDKFHKTILKLYDDQELSESKMNVFRLVVGTANLFDFDAGLMTCAGYFYEKKRMEYEQSKTRLYRNRF